MFASSSEDLNSSKNYGLKEYVSNMVENRYCKIEEKLNTIFILCRDNKLKNCHIQNSKQYIIEYIIHQFYRTPMCRDRIVKLITTDNDIKKLYFKHWWFFAQFLAEELINENDYSIVLINNNTEVNFITSTSPAMMRSNNGFYMPLSPNKGISIVSVDAYPEEDIIEDSSIIDFINSEMIEYSKEFKSTLISTNNEQLTYIDKQK